MHPMILAQLANAHNAELRRSAARARAARLIADTPSKARSPRGRRRARAIIRPACRRQGRREPA